MNHSGTKQKHALSIILGPSNSGCPSDTATLPSQISRALHTHTVCHWSVERNGAITYNRSSMVVPPLTAFQIANLGLGHNWYASLFCQWPTTTQKGPDWSVNDIDAPTQYDPSGDAFKAHSDKLSTLLARLIQVILWNSCIPWMNGNDLYHFFWMKCFGWMDGGILWIKRSVVIAKFSLPHIGAVIVTLIGYAVMNASSIYMSVLPFIASRWVMVFADETNIHLQSFLIQHWEDHHFVCITLKDLVFEYSLNTHQRKYAIFQYELKATHFSLSIHMESTKSALTFVAVKSPPISCHSFFATSCIPQPPIILRQLQCSESLTTFIFWGLSQSVLLINSIKASHRKRITLVFYMSESIILLQSLVLP